jgi:hypothetical protein
MVDFLSHKLRTPPSHILCLIDNKATRHAIITGFWNHLIRNHNIEHGDAIVIFYAGHSSQTDTPKGWVSDDNKIDTICPHDEGIVGRDHTPILGISDRTINALLRRLASTKGDNIVRPTLRFCSNSFFPYLFVLVIRRSFSIPAILTLERVVIRCRVPLRCIVPC